MFRLCHLWVIACVLTSCARPAYQEQGWASYIADHYTGRMTSSGQPYYPQSYTAAHTSLPFGTEVSVKNLYTGRSVTVVVTDRFPYYPGRVINLSRAAAQYIGIPNMQLAQVEVKAYKLPYGGQAYPPQQQYYPQQQQYAPQTYSPQQQMAYQPQPQSYQPQPQSYQPQQYYQPQPQPQAPRTTAPTYPAQAATPQPTTPRFVAPRTTTPAAPGAPNAPAFNGSNGPPPGLNVF